MQRLQAQMKAHLAVTAPLTIDPSLLSESVHSTTEPTEASTSSSVPLGSAPTLDTSTEPTATRASTSSFLAIDPSLLSESVHTSEPAGASTSSSVPLGSAPTPDTSTESGITSSFHVTLTPHREVTPLTDIEDTLPLTPIINKQGKKPKAVKEKGKRPVDEGDDGAGASCPKRSRRSRV
jgi:hypothetical protein